MIAAGQQRINSRITMTQLPLNFFSPLTAGPAIAALKSWPQYGHTLASHEIDLPQETQFLAGPDAGCSVDISDSSTSEGRVHNRSLPTPE